MFLSAALWAVTLAVTPDPETHETVAGLEALAPDLAAMQEVTLSAYGVPGRNAQSIRRNLDRLRPAEPEGGRYDALTTWRYSWRFNSREAQCRPQTIEVKVAINVLLPQLVEYANLSKRERSRWDRYFSALVEHETNHARIAIKGAQDLQSGLREMETCDQLAERGRQLSEDISEASLLYDRQTRHGRLEGAVYP